MKKNCKQHAQESKEQLKNNGLKITTARLGLLDILKHAKKPLSIKEITKQLGDAGVQVIGLDASAPTALHEMSVSGPTVLVIGSEHRGLGQGIRSRCQSLARLLSSGTLDSLNASVAAGIALHTVLISRIITAR